MSHPTFWPKNVFFYPVGNTPPACLTDHLPPEENARVLLLGCGDPRNILYTIAFDHGIPTRKMDITCCDLEPAIISRNILLFTFIIDSVDTSNLLIYWNIFYDLFLDRPSVSLLGQQCDKLLEYSMDMDSWCNSCYGSKITFATQDSLAQVRRHWKLYRETLDLPNNEQHGLKEEFRSAMKENLSREPDLTVTSITAAVPAMSRFPTSINTYTGYWSNGITGSKDKTRPFINPTFLFSLVGRKFNLHYGTDLCSAFHLALALLKTSSPKKTPNSLKPPVKTEHEMWAACRAQFSDWCLATHEKFRSPPATSQSEGGDNSNLMVIRFVIADALFLCDGLRSYQNDVLETKVYRAPWGVSKLHFHNQSIPKYFNVIDTSNLSDHLGLLNVLIAAQPLMEYSPCSILHTNTLLSYNDNPTERSALEERALLDFPSISLFLGITPICFSSGFNFRNNCETATFAAVNSGGRNRNHEQLSWRVCDFACSTPTDGLSSHQQVVIEPNQLADKLFTLYLKMFKDEMLNLKPSLLTIFQIPHYNRESFVRFVSTVKTNQRLQTDWTAVGKGLVDRATLSNRLIVGSNNFQNLFAELHIHGIYSVPQLQVTTPSTKFSKTFQGWGIVPPLVCVVLIIPRSALEVLNAQHSIFQCETFSDENIFHNTHSSIRPVFGELVVLPDGRGTIHEDPRGIDGDSNLIVSFYVASWILAQYPNLMVGFGLKSTPQIVGVFLKKLGPFLRIFAKRLTDRNHIFLFRERPDNEGEFKPVSGSDGRRFQRHLAISKLSFDSRGVGWFCKRIDIVERLAKDSLGNNAPVSRKDTSPRCIEASFGGYHYPFRFPIPVDGSRSKMRIARKSSYVEIEVPFRLSPLTQLDFQPFPLVPGGPKSAFSFMCWNVPYVNLDRLSMVAATDHDWFSSHIAFAYSKAEREERMRSDSLKNASFSVNFKASIQAMITDFNGDKVRVVSLRNDTTSHIFAFVFLNSIKLDLSSGTVIADGLVVVPEKPIIIRLLASAVRSEGVSEIKCFGEETQWWRYALPVFAERCRNWKHNTSTCQYALSSSYPLPLESPLCSCGKGKNLGSFMDNPKWKPLAPYATRVAISIIFPVTYLEDATFDMGMISTVEKSNPATSRTEVCHRCKGPGKPKMLQCSGCKVTKYCSGECQKEDWKLHKVLCKNMKTVLEGIVRK